MKRKGRRNDRQAKKITTTAQSNGQKFLDDDPWPGLLSCEHFGCTDEIFAACPICLCVLCFKHFDDDSACSAHSMFALDNHQGRGRGRGQRQGREVGGGGGGGGKVPVEEEQSEIRAGKGEGKAEGKKGSRKPNAGAEGVRKRAGEREKEDTEGDSDSFDLVGSILSRSMRRSTSPDIDDNKSDIDVKPNKGGIIEDIFGFDAVLQSEVSNNVEQEGDISVNEHDFATFDHLDEIASSHEETELSDEARHEDGVLEDGGWTEDSVSEEEGHAGLETTVSGLIGSREGDGRKGNMRKEQKQRRNNGLAYIGAGGKIKPQRQLRPRCSRNSKCQMLNLHCRKLAEDERLEIRDSFYRLGDLQRQREWIVAQTNRHPCEKPVGHRKKLTYHYFLPGRGGEGKKRVCRSMFLNTLSISDTFVVTSWAKISTAGTLHGEKRGGDRQARDNEILREEVEEHIDRFPKVESHYCRKFDHHEYLAPDLNIAKMFAMYKDGGGRASYSLYKKIFRRKGLRFNKPKKDLCSICESFRKAPDTQKEQMRAQYIAHNLEKTTVRDLKEEVKRKAQDEDDALLVTVFDLQQVIPLPITSRGDVFYKQRLNVLNFTVFEVVSKEGFCFLWHQGIARRGSNEVASCLWSYLNDADEKGYEEVIFFADGCPGQNKNSILPSMFLYFVSHISVHIKKVSLFYFEAHHGQNEGDSMHSVIERAKKTAGEIFLPSQLATMIRMARKHPRAYHVHDMETDDILDWKELSQEYRVLKVRQTDEGQVVDWTKVRAVQVSKTSPNQIKVKTTHLQDNFQTITLNNSRRNNISDIRLPKAAYLHGPPKVPADTYKNLKDLFEGATPISTREEYKDFYKNLPH